MSPAGEFPLNKTVFIPVLYYPMTNSQYLLNKSQKILSKAMKDLLVSHYNHLGLKNPKINDYYFHIQQDIKESF